MIEKEELQRGSVSRKVYTYYLKSMGVPLVALVLLTYVYLTGFGIYKNFWLAKWSNAGVNASSIVRNGTLYFRSQILERHSIGEYWNISGVPELPKNVIFTFFRTC